MLRMFKSSSKPSLYLRLEGCKALVRQRRWAVAYRYVPRELNAAADNMCTQAREAGASIEHWDGVLPEGAPPVDITALYRKVDKLARGDDGVLHIATGLFYTLGEEWAAQGDVAEWGGDRHQ